MVQLFDTDCNTSWFVKLTTDDQRKKLEQMNNEEIPDLEKAQLLVPIFGLESLDTSSDDNSTDEYYYYYDGYDDYFDDNSTNTTKPETTTENTPQNVTKNKVGKKKANSDFAK